MGEEACDDTFKAKAPRITFSDIFETAAGDAAKGTCPAGFTGVNTSGTFECLKLKEGMELWASRFECRRCARWVSRVFFLNIYLLSRFKMEKELREEKKGLPHRFPGAKQ